MKDGKKTKIFLVAAAVIFLGLPLLGISQIVRQWLGTLVPFHDFWYGYMAYFGTVALALTASWLAYKANQKVDKANDISSRLLAIEEQARSPFLEIRRDKCKIENLRNDQIRLQLCVVNISNQPVHNVKLSIGSVCDSDVLSEYTEENFHSWMLRIAKMPLDGLSPEDGIDFVASLSESSIRKKTTNKDGQREQIVLESIPSDMMNFYITANFDKSDCYLQAVFFMQDIIGQLFKQTTTLYITEKTDGCLFMFNHSTKVQKIML